MTRRAERATSSRETFRGERVVLALEKTIRQRKRWLERRREAATSMKEARQHEKTAAGYTDAQIPWRGKSYLAAGRAYLNGNDLDAAARTLELAQPDLEIYARSGAKDAYMALSHLYPALRDVYEHTGQAGRLKAIRGRELGLYADIKEHFGIQMTVVSDNSVMITQAAPEEPPQAEQYPPF